MSSALVIGAGPAGLMAADVLSAGGVAVTLADQMPSVGRKFLMAGKSGLNLTKMDAEFGDKFQGTMADMVADFGPDDVVEWARGLGQEVFTGTTGRVFPKVMKASPLLRAWMGRLGDQGVDLRTRHRWVGWDVNGDARFETPTGPVTLTAGVTVLALGGGSWARLGSDGAWMDLVGPVAPLRPANVGFEVAWSDHMAPHLGKPIKNIRLSAGDLTSRGEIILSRTGIEGGGLYDVSRAVRDGAPLVLDLVPDTSLDAVRKALARRGKASLGTHLRKALRLTPAKVALLQEFARPLPQDPAPLIKALPVPHDGPRPLDQAISTAGGLRFEGVDDGLMLRDRPGVFAAGEMLDWEAPTGGYLITGCLATGRHAGLAALRHLGRG